MGLFHRKEKTWQELKVEEDEVRRIEAEKKSLQKFNNSIDDKEKDVIENNVGLSSKELKTELKKYPRKRRKKLEELYQQYQKGLMLQPGKDIDNKQFILERL